MGQPLQAIEFLRQSLNYTRTLNIPFGTSVNLYNLSKLSVEGIGKGSIPEEHLLELLVEGLDDLDSTGYEDPALFYTLTNTALLLSRQHYERQDTQATLEDTVQHIHRQFRFDTLPWSYYTRAESLLKKPALFSDDQRAPLTFLVKLNQAELAKNASLHQKSLNFRRPYTHWWKNQKVLRVGYGLSCRPKGQKTHHSAKSG